MFTLKLDGVAVTLVTCKLGYAALVAMVSLLVEARERPLDAPVTVMLNVPVSPAVPDMVTWLV